MTSTRCSGRVGARVGAVPGHQRLLHGQRQLVVQGQRVVGADLRAEPVLQRGDDPAPVGVVLGVGAGHQDQVQRQPQRVAAHPDVPFLEHVEQRDLDPLGQVGQLVQAEDAPVGPGHQAEVDGLRITQGAALGHLDRVDVADQVAHAGVRRGQLLAVPLAAVPPGDRQVVAQFRGQPLAARADRLVRVVVDLAALDGRAPLVEQHGQGADQPRLTLAPLAEQDRVVPGQHGPLDVRQHGLAEADDAGEAVFARAHPGQQVAAQFVFDGLVPVPGGAQFAQGCRAGPGRDGVSWGSLVV